MIAVGPNRQTCNVNPLDLLPGSLAGGIMFATGPISAPPSMLIERSMNYAIRHKLHTFDLTDAIYSSTVCEDAASLSTEPCNTVSSFSLAGVQAISSGWIMIWSDESSDEPLRGLSSTANLCSRDPSCSYNSCDLFILVLRINF